MLKIVFKNSEVKNYRETEYTDYHYDGKVFAVINDKQWIGIYNMDAVATIEYIAGMDAVATIEYIKGRYDEVFSS